MMPGSTPATFPRSQPAPVTGTGLANPKAYPSDVSCHVSFATVKFKFWISSPVDTSIASKKNSPYPVWSGTASGPLSV